MATRKKAPPVYRASTPSTRAKAPAPFTADESIARAQDLDERGVEAWYEEDGRTIATLRAYAAMVDGERRTKAWPFVPVVTERKGDGLRHIRREGARHGELTRPGNAGERAKLDGRTREERARLAATPKEPPADFGRIKPNDPRRVKQLAGIRERARCPVCGKMMAVQPPRGGDGSVDVFPRHKDRGGSRCGMSRDVVRKNDYVGDRT